MYEAEVKIGLKEGVSDPEGKNTLKALHLLGFKQVKKAKTYRTVHLDIEEKNKEQVKNNVEKMCKKLLTNPVIHDYSIKIKKKQ